MQRHIALLRAEITTELVARVVSQQPCLNLERKS